MKILALSTALAVSASCAYAQCETRESMSASLKERYGEVVVAQGINSLGVFELWMNPTTGTWTATVYFPDGRMCVLEAGSDMHLPEIKPPGEEM